MSPTTQVSLLENLPTEIIQQIYRLLPVYSAAALSLTSKRMQYIVGCLALDCLRKKPRDVVGLREFLVLLEKDVSQTYACLHCLKLRDFNELTPRSELSFASFHNRRCRRRELWGSRRIFFGRKFSFFRLHSAMEEYRTTATTTILQKVGYSNDSSGLFFKIVCGRILMHGHQRFHFRGYIRKSQVLLRLERLFVCQHISCKSRHWHMLSQLLHCIPKKAKDGELCSRCASLFSCTLCPSEFRARVQHHGPNDFSIIIARWLDFGDCSSPNEPRYRSHMSAHSTIRRYRQDVPILRYQPGSIKAAYESSELPKSEEVLD
ncbi:hypothetical protein MMC10_007111 [Thelotrema lepadinum]|nr:hypothetical protein [Thelotrema lepadinum]